MASATRTLVMVLAASSLAGCDSDPAQPTLDAEPVMIRVVWSNPSAPGALDGADILIAPGVWAVLPPDTPVFELGSPPSAGLERLAEDGENLTMRDELDALDPTAFGTFGVQRPGENYEDNPLGPGDDIELVFGAMSDERVTVAGMFIESNDVFVAPSPEGIALDGLQVGETLDVSDQLGLYDAGSEANEPPGAGPNQPMRQSAVDTGNPGEGTVSELDDGFDYPPSPPSRA